MTDQVGDVVSYRREGRVGTIIAFKSRDRVRVRHFDTRQPQDITYKKKELDPVLEVHRKGRLPPHYDLPGHVQHAERTP